MTREEDLVRSTTEAIAATVRDVPPLRLERAAEQLRVPAVRDRRWRSWGVPVVAAVLVVALAIALVAIKGITNGGVANRIAPSVTGPGGAPRYYAALGPASANSSTENELVVGDTVTGKVLATYPAAADTSFASVSAAADDQTFVALQVTDPDKRTGKQTEQWFEIKLEPGTVPADRLMQVPIKPAVNVVATALSGSGTELAVASSDQVLATRDITVYSLASGHVLAHWHTHDPSNSIFTPNAGFFASQSPALTWIDDDHAIAFTTEGQGYGANAAQADGDATESVRVIDVTGPRTGNLVADSRVIWSRQPFPCQGVLPLVSADGKTITCVSVSRTPPVSAVKATGPVTWTLTWLTYPASAQAPSAGQPTVVYRVTERGAADSLGLGGAIWANSTGSAIIGAWSVYAPSKSSTMTKGEKHMIQSIRQAAKLKGGMALIDLAGPGPDPQVGVISNGRLTPLRLPAGVAGTSPLEFAW